jgi:glycosyltransferase involved in cell wall biosynthesis
LIADNGSSDGSVEYARARGARVVAVTERGYGAALRAGIAAAQGRFVVMGDADDSYDFSRLDPFLAKLRDGCDLVMGNRFAGRYRTRRHAVPAPLSRQSRAQPDRPLVLPRGHPRFPLPPARL